MQSLERFILNAKKFPLRKEEYKVLCSHETYGRKCDDVEVTHSVIMWDEKYHQFENNAPQGRLITVDSTKVRCAKCKRGLPHTYRHRFVPDIEILNGGINDKVIFVPEITCGYTNPVTGWE